MLLDAPGRSPEEMEIMGQPWNYVTLVEACTLVSFARKHFARVLNESTKSWHERELEERWVIHHLLGVRGRLGHQPLSDARLLRVVPDLNVWGAGVRGPEVHSSEGQYRHRRVRPRSGLACK